MSFGRPGEGFDSETDVKPDPGALERTAIKQCPSVTWTDAAGMHVVPLGGPTLVGSASHAAILVSDGAVSRIHAEIEPRDDGVWIRDLGSRNGTFIGDVRVSAARIPAGGSVTVGATVLTLREPERPTAVELWPHDHFGPMLGRSVVMRELFSRLDRIARTTSTVLIEGETGTGKELVARAIHDASPRAQGPFVVVDCAALPEHLLETELFGHAKGAFTGAVASRAGALELATGGTVFLDEIGELPTSMQPKLLRAIESRSVRRIGEGSSRDLDIRIVAATNRDLRTMVNAGAFREDLFFRLAVVPITVPPLRARREDLPLLVARFLPKDAPPSAAAALLARVPDHPWLGNVRELRNFVERAIAFGANDPRAVESVAPKSRPGDAFAPIDFDEPFKDIRERWVAHLEREYIAELLRRHQRNTQRVAEAAGLDRAYVYRLMKRHDL